MQSQNFCEGLQFFTKHDLKKQNLRLLARSIQNCFDSFSRHIATSDSISFCLAFFRVLGKVRLRGKTVSAAVTDVRPLFRMNTFMDSQIISAKKPLLTNVTAVRFLATVRKKMARQACFQREPPVTNRAGVQPLLCVSSLVPGKRELPLEASTAVTADVRLPCRTIYLNAMYF